MICQEANGYLASGFATTCFALTESLLFESEDVVGSGLGTGAGASSFFFAIAAFENATMTKATTKQAANFRNI